MKDSIAEYMDRLRDALGGLPLQKQQQIMTELQSHVAEGLADERLGSNDSERKAALMREMGNPDELGHELQRIERGRRWLDFLLAAVPALFLIELLQIVVMSFFYLPNTTLFNEVALAALPICLIMLAVAHWRRSDALLIFWLLTTLGQILFPLQWAVLDRPLSFFVLFWAALGLASLAWLLAMLWRVRRVSLLLAFGTFPLLLYILESIPIPRQAATLFVETIGSPMNQAVASFPQMLQAARVSEFALTLVALGVFFISQRRLLRWTALGLFLLAPSLPAAFFFGLNGNNSRIIITLPVVLLTVGMGILIEQRKRQHRARYTS